MDGWGGADCSTSAGTSRLQRRINGLIIIIIMLNIYIAFEEAREILDCTSPQALGPQSTCHLAADIEAFFALVCMSAWGPKIFLVSFNKLTQHMHI